MRNENVDYGDDAIAIDTDDFHDVFNDVVDDEDADDTSDDVKGF